MNPKKDSDFQLYRMLTKCIKKIDKKLSNLNAGNERTYLLNQRDEISTRRKRVMGRFIVRWQEILWTPEQLKAELQKTRNALANAGIEFTIDEIKQGKHFLL